VSLSIVSVSRVGRPRPRLPPVDHTSARLEVEWNLELEGFTVDLRHGCFHVYGELVGRAPLMTEQLAWYAAANRSPVQLDLSEVTFMDSGGLCQLLALRQSLPAMRIVAMSTTVQRKLELTGTARLIL
jgi:anti-anti-sigma factor